MPSDPVLIECVECGADAECVLRFDGEPVCEECFDIHLAHAEDFYGDTFYDEDLFGL